MLNIFSRLAAGEEMPVREKTRVRRGRTAAHRPRGARQHPRRGTACPQARRLYRRLGWQQVMLLLWVVISAGLLAVALVLNNSGHKACIRSKGTTCPSPSIPQHANASHVMHLRHLVLRDRSQQGEQVREQSGHPPPPSLRGSPIRLASGNSGNTTSTSQRHAAPDLRP
jgi:hypothetical protein